MVDAGVFCTELMTVCWGIGRGLLVGLLCE
jgi:hypothetical protein